MAKQQNEDIFGDTFFVGEALKKNIFFLGKTSSIDVPSNLQRSTKLLSVDPKFVLVRWYGSNLKAWTEIGGQM